MSKKAIIELELKADGYKAEIADIQKANTAISDSATKAANQATEAYTQTGKAAKTAFASTEVQKALVTQGAAVGKLTESLSKMTPAAKSANQSLEGIDKSVKKLNVDVPKTAKDVAALEDELRQLAIEGKQNTEQFNLIAKAIGTFKASITIADRAVDLYAKTTDAATGRIGELEDKLYDLALAGQSNTKEFKDLVTEVAKVRRAVIETDAQVDNLAQRGSGIKSFAQSVELVGVAFQAAEGAQALFGTDSEELQKTLVRLNAIMAITSAIEQGRQILLEQIAAKTGIAAVAQRAYALAVGTSTGALKGFRLALAATGIGLIVFGISELIKGFEKLSEENERFTNAFLKSNEAIKASREGINSLANIALDAETRIAVASKRITQGQADLNKELKDIKTTAGEAYAPIISAQLDVNKELQKVNIQIEKQRLILKSLEGVSGAENVSNRKDAEKTLNNELAKKDKLESQLLKLETRKQEVSKNSVRAQVAVINASKLEEESKKKVIKQQRIQIELLSDEAIKRSQVELAQLKSLDLLSDIEDTSQQTRIQTRQNFLEKNEILEGSSLARRITLIELEGEKRKADTFDQIDDAKERQTAIELIEAQTQAAIRAERKRTVDESIQIAQEYVAVVANLASELNELSRINTETSINDINLRSEAELQAINQSLDTERQKQREREALEFRTNRAIVAEKNKQAKRDKALALFQAGIDLATSIVKTGATLGYPAAIPFQVVAGIVGAAQIAAIASQPIPKFEKGGEVRGKRHRDGGTLIEAEQGEYIVNRNQTRRHSEEISALNRSTAEFHRLLERKYIQPRIASILSGTNRRSDKVVVNATLNARTMEGELKGLRKDIRRSASKGYKSNQTDTRYQWQRN